MFLVPLLNDSFIRKKQKSSVLYKQLLDYDYCLIFLKKHLIICSYFKYSSSNQVICRINFYGISSSMVFNLMTIHQNILSIISLRHALYLGKEIYKAELSYIFIQKYIQL